MFFVAGGRGLYGCGSDSAADENVSTDVGSEAPTASQESQSEGMEQTEALQENQNAPMEQTEASQEELSEESNVAEAVTYEDLPREETMYVEQQNALIAINMPDVYVDSYGNGVGSGHSLDYYYVAACGSDVMPDTNLEEAFLALLNGEMGYHSVLRGCNRATYGEMTPNMEYVTLDSGREAIKFEGIQSQDDYGTYRDCPVYGYAVMCEDVPVIVSYIIINADNVDEDTQMEMVHVVDEMVNTIRMKK